MRYITIAELSDMIRQNLWKIPHDIDLVVGIPRSGLMAANMIALYLNKRLSDLDSFIEGRIIACGDYRSCMVNQGPVRKVLIVDDSVGSGATINKAKKKLTPFVGKYEFSYFAPIVSSVGIIHIDSYAEIIDGSRIFEWNLFHHPLINNTCFDMDGVLCCNPTKDDDGKEYLKFIHTAKPLFVPTAIIDTIITCRLEKYRNLTEEWLRINGIKYNKLMMINLPDKESRTKWGKNGEYKGEYYRNSGNSLFIESSLCEAEVIARISKKTVICIETNQMITYSDKSEIRGIKVIIKNKFPKVYNILKKTYHRVY